MLELEKYLSAESRTRKTFDVQLKTNLAFVYYLKSGEVVLIPGNFRNESKGLLFESKKCYEGCLEKDHFPIENSPMPIYEKCQDDVLDLKNKMKTILYHLDSLLGNSLKKNTFGESDLSTLLQRLRAEKKDKLSLKDKFYMALALGEYLRVKANGSWLLLKRYGDYNPYYVPALHYSSNDQVLLILNAFSSFIDDPTMTPEKFSTLQYIKEPGFTFESLKYAKYPNPYKELK